MRDNHKTKEQLIQENAELRQRVAGVERAETERKQAEEALQERDENIRILAENAADGIAIVANNGTYLYVNRKSAKTKGYRVDELLHANLRDFFSPAEYKEVSKQFKKRLAGKAISNQYETEIIRKDGTHVPIEASIALTTWRGKQVRIVFSRDITERKQTEEALRDSEERYRVIFEQSPFGVGISSLDGTVVATNKAMEAITGYSGAELKKIRLVDTHENLKERKALLKAMSRYGNVVDFPARLKRKDGTGYDALLNISRINLGGKDCFHAICQDITERKRTEEALQESEGRYRTLIDNIDLGINLIDTDHNVLMANAFMGKRFNKPVSELIEKKCFREFEKREAVCPHCPGVQTMATGKPAEVETKGVRDDGSNLDVRIQTFPVSGQDGTTTAFIEIVEDITERKRVEEALRESEEKYRTILATMKEGYYEVDLAGNFTFFNESLCRIHGYSHDELMDMNNREYMDEGTAKRVYKIFNKVLRTGKSAKIYDWQIIRKDGSKPDLEASVSPIRDSGGNSTGFRGIVRDITERKQAGEELRQSEEKYRTILESIEDAYFENDLRGNLTFFNDSLCRMFGYARDELLSLGYRDYMDEENAKKVFQKYNRVYTTGEPDKEIAYEIIAKDGSKRHIDISVSLIKDAGGQPVGFRGVGRDRTERKRTEKELEYMATHDSLTDLPNRTLSTDRLTMALAQAQRSKKTLAVMLVDLDYFKNVNDTLGHGVGDQLLRLVGNRLAEVLRKGDTVARVGGDEFLLLLPEIAQLKDANTVAQKILQAFREPFAFNDHELHITTSIGIAVYPDDGDDADTLMKNADIAMYRAKDKGRDNFQRYTPA